MKRHNTASERPQEHGQLANVTRVAESCFCPSILTASLVSLSIRFSRYIYDRAFSFSPALQAEIQRHEGLYLYILVIFPTIRIQHPPGLDLLWGPFRRLLTCRWLS